MADDAVQRAGQSQDRFEQVLGARPELLRDYTGFHGLFWERRLVPLELLELVRLNVARLLGCESELRRRHCVEGAPLVDDEEVRGLSSPGYLGLGEGARACLRFSEKFLFDVHGIDDADVDALRARLGVEGTVAFTEALALFDGFTRFRNLLVPDARGAGDAELVYVPVPTLPAPGAAPEPA